MSFEVGVTRELRDRDGTPLVDIGLGELPASEIAWRFLDAHPHELRPADVAEFDAVLVWDAAVTRATLEGSRRLKLVARLGVGLDDIDVAACSDAGVLVTITPDAVRRPVASGAVAFMLALSHRITQLDRVVRAGHWYDEVRGAAPPISGATVAVIGLGNIGREVVRLLRPWQPQLLAFDPYVPPDSVADVEVLDLGDALGRADFIVVTCPLTEQTRHLLNSHTLAQCKRGAYLVNVARGAIVDTDALVAALHSGQVAGAALDVLEVEPPPADHELLTFDNVILAPHAVALTDDFNLAVGKSALASIEAVALGERPRLAVNADAVGSTSASQ